MKALKSQSLASTVDNLAAALFESQPLPAAQRIAAAKWIAGRQGLPGAYAGMFGATELDMRGIRLFTGEAIRTRAGITHVLGEESCRVLHLLGVRLKEVKSAHARALAGIARRIDESEKAGYPPGFYCCGTCTVAYWRNLATGRLPRSEERLRQGLGQLGKLRRGDGLWRRFPFYYTSLALTEITPGLAREEAQYAAARWEQVLKRLSRADDVYSRRRTAIGRRILEQCANGPAGFGTPSGGDCTR